MTFNLKSFEVEVTPYHYDFGLLSSQNVLSIETPIFLRGFVLTEEHYRYCVCTVEFCIISGFFYQDLLTAISRSTGVPLQHVTLHVSHQHDVPFFDELYHGTLMKYERSFYPYQKWLDYVNEIEGKISNEMKQTEKQVMYYSMSEQEVFEYASDRRIFQNNKINWRSTKCQNPELKAMPIGEIDPNLYQCVLWDSQKSPLLTLNFYASHPQVADSRGIISSDAPGAALKRMKKLLPNTMHLYFDGCGADIGNGKFAGPSKEADIEIFGEKLFQGMSGAYQNAKPEKISKVRWLNHTFDLPIRKPMENIDEYLQAIKSPELFQPQFKPSRFVVARNIGLFEKKVSHYPFRISRLCFNDDHIMFFPGEMFLTFQTHCITRSSGKTCVAAYGDGFVGYVPEDDDFALGGYEIDGAFQLLSPGCEKLIKSEIDKILKL